MALQFGDMVVYDSLMGSNVKPVTKSLVREMYDRLSTAPGSSIPQSGPTDWQGGFWQMLGRQGESVGVGSALAAVNVFADKGLDSGPLGTPLDLMAGLALGAGSVPRGTKVGAYLATAGANCMAVFSYRKTTEFLAEKRLAAGAGLPKHLSPGASRVAGENNISRDPVVEAASAL